MTQGYQVVGLYFSTTLLMTLGYQQVEKFLFGILIMLSFQCYKYPVHCFSSTVLTAAHTRSSESSFSRIISLLLSRALDNILQSLTHFLR